MPNITPLSPKNAYRVEKYTDLAAGHLERHVPVTQDGVQDPMRMEIFVGSTMMQTNRGPVELRFDIVATTLQQAFDEWTPALEAKLEQMQSEATKQRILNGVGMSPAQSKLIKGN